ncbi:DinB family protein [Amphritea atlantica]|uniref:DinB family protein n=1 Tax=Amphritea atlantica TaxID=355243 RepID=A0ABY5GW48_9GAMM|nr:DinB family protein [Amphritea atlantica]
MITPAYCQTMARYNANMNDQLYNACATIADQQRRADMKLFFKSIHGTLDHLMFGDIAWLSRFMGKDSEVPEFGAILYPDFSELAEARKEWDQKIIEWADHLEQSWLESDFSYVSKVDGSSRTKPAWLLATHMFNHSTHHRGQLTAALSQLDIDFGVADLPFVL